MNLYTPLCRSLYRSRERVGERAAIAAPKTKVVINQFGLAEEKWQA